MMNTQSIFSLCLSTVGGAQSANLSSYWSLAPETVVPLLVLGAA